MKPSLTELFNLCNYCVYAPCFCGNEPENCADYVVRKGIALHEAPMVDLTDIVDIDQQTKDNNAAMRKVIDFVTGGLE